MKILVRLPNWLGDVVMATAFLQALHECYPTASIDVIIKSELAPITKYIPQIHSVFPFSKKQHKGFIGLYRFGKRLQKNSYTLFFSLPDSFSSALMGRASGAKKRIGYKKEGRSFLLSDSYKKPKGKHRVNEYLGLLEKFGADFTGKKAIRLAAKTDKKNRLIINFNSEAISRRMPVEKGREILQAISQEFAGYEIALIGAPKEKEYINEIIAYLNTVFIKNYAGETSIDELILLIASAKLMLSTDSGPAHLANALDIPLLVLFGAGNEKNTAPFNKEKLEILRLNQLPCEPCVKNTCIFGLPKCLQLLETNLIINTLKNLVHA